MNTWQIENFNFQLNQNETTFILSINWLKQKHSYKSRYAIAFQWRNHGLLSDYLCMEIRENSFKFSSISNEFFIHFHSFPELSLLVGNFNIPKYFTMKSEVCATLTFRHQIPIEINTKERWARRSIVVFIPSVIGF